MRVGELARRTGVGVSTLRAWERRFGIIEPARSASGHRLYTEGDVERVSAVCRLVDEGLTLSAAVSRVATAGPGALLTHESRSRADFDARIRAALLNSAGEAAMAAEPDGTVVYANPAAERLFGWRATEVIGQNGLEIFPAPAAATDAADVHGRLLAKKRYTGELLLTRRDRTQITCYMNAGPIVDDTGALIGVGAVFTDRSERVRLEREKRALTQQAETIALLGARVLRRQPTPEQSIAMILTEVVDATRRLLASDRAAIVEVAPSLEGRVRAASPPVDEHGTVAGGSRSLAGYTALARKVVLVEDAANERRFEVGPLNGVLNVLSAIAAPVFGAHGVCAVLTAESSTPNTFDRAAVQFMQGMANVVGVALS
jgi:PAS domain S-box-containing protein